MKTQAQVTQNAVAADPTPEPEYDPASEEDTDGEAVAETVVTAPPVVVTAAPTMNSVYAGASPVVIDPIDKPTPSPVPALTFEAYTVYDATNLGLSFEAPVGWTEDDSVSGSYTITNPDRSCTYQAFMTISVTTVSSTYNKTQLTSAVKTMLNNVKASLDCTAWSPSSTADRTLLDATGVYANYTATLTGGIKIAGRVQVACIGTKLYMVHISYPADYAETYKTGVYNRMRNTIKLTK